jgi:hypothetical protein
MSAVFKTALSLGVLALLLHSASAAGQAGGVGAPEWRSARVGQALGTPCGPQGTNGCTIRNIGVAASNPCNGAGGSKACSLDIPQCGYCYAACVVTVSVYDTTGSTWTGVCVIQPATCGGLRDGVGAHIAKARRLICDVTSSGCKCGSTVYDQIDCPQVVSSMPWGYCFP